MRLHEGGLPPELRQTPRVDRTTGNWSNAIWSAIKHATEQYLEHASRAAHAEAKARAWVGANPDAMEPLLALERAGGSVRAGVLPAEIEAGLAAAGLVILRPKIGLVGLSRAAEMLLAEARADHV